MRTLFYAISFCAPLLISAGCDKEETAQPTAETRSSIAPINSPPAAKNQDICALLTKTEIEAVQSSPIREATGTVRADGGLRIAQCFYTAQDYSKSVVLSTTETDFNQQKPQRNLKQLWDKTFHRELKANKEDEDETKREGGEEEHEFPPPKKISGLGEEAFWSSGSLYDFYKRFFHSHRDRRAGIRRDKDREIENARRESNRALLASRCLFLTEEICNSETLRGRFQCRDELLEAIGKRLWRSFQ